MLATTAARQTPEATISTSSGERLRNGLQKRHGRLLAWCQPVPSNHSAVSAQNKCITLGAIQLMAKFELPKGLFRGGNRCRYSTPAPAPTPTPALPIAPAICGAEWSGRREAEGGSAERVKRR